MPTFAAPPADQTIALATQDAATIRRVAGLCLKRVPLDQRLRLLGVRVASLVPVAACTLPTATAPPGAGRERPGAFLTIRVIM